eukprot:10389831-Lingulodinium_polyedra.AAC.1
MAVRVTGPPSLYWPPRAYRLSLSTSSTGRIATSAARPRWPASRPPYTVARCPPSSPRHRAKPGRWPATDQ